jgi:hypothetical protein
MFQNFKEWMDISLSSRKVFADLTNNEFVPFDPTSDALQAAFKAMKPRETANDLIPHYPGNFKATLRKPPGETFIVKSSTEFREDLKRKQNMREQEEKEKEERKAERIRKSQLREAETERKKIERIEKAKHVAEKKKLQEEEKKNRKLAALLKKQEKMVPKKRGRPRKNPLAEVKAGDAGILDNDLLDISKYI